MIRCLFESRTTVLIREAQERVLEKKIELEKLKAALRQRVSLTDDEIDSMGGNPAYIRAIEAKLREKNGG